MNVLKKEYQLPVSKHSQNFNQRCERIGLNADECIAWAKENCINLEDYQIDILRAFAKVEKYIRPEESEEQLSRKY